MKNISTDNIKAEDSNDFGGIVYSLGDTFSFQDVYSFEQLSFYNHQLLNNSSRPEATLGEHFTLLEETKLEVSGVFFQQ